MAVRRAEWRLAMAFAFCAGCGTPRASADELIARGVARAARSDFAGAIAAYDSALAIDSLLASAWRNRGVAWSQQERYDRAIPDLDRAIALDPAGPSAFNSRGVAYQGKGDYERAIQDYDEAVRLKPDHALAIKGRGRCNFYLGRFAEAAADLERGLGYDSTNAYVAIWLHLANQRTDRDDAPRFAANIARTDSLRWPGAVARYYLKRIDRAQLLAAAAQVDPRVGRDQRGARPPSSWRRRPWCSARGRTPRAPSGKPATGVPPRGRSIRRRWPSSVGWGSRHPSNGRPQSRAVQPP